MIIVTGASGLVGSHLISALSARYAQEKIIALYNQNEPQITYANVEYRQCDLKDWDETLQHITEHAEVYHCAALVDFDKKSRNTLIEDNVLMTENVVNAALLIGIKKLVHISSIAALSREKNNTEDHKHIDEKSQWTNSSNNSKYAQSKYYAELEVWRGIEEGLNAVIVNPGIILGECVDWEKGSSALIHKVSEGLKYYTEGVNGYVDVTDVVQAMILLMESDVNRERFIIVENNYTYQELFSKIAQNLDVKAPHVLAKPWMSKLVVCAETIKSFITRRPQLITKETARTAFQINHYNNQKLLKLFPQYKYTPFDTSIKRITNAYKMSKKSSKIL